MRAMKVGRGAIPALALLLALLLPLAGVVPAQAADPGQAVFKRNCAICHSDQPEHNRVGPTLAGVVGRPAGSVPDFTYSAANKGSGITWTRDKLDAYLTDPQAVVPGTAMMFPGIKNPDDRHALIDYLATLPAG